MHVVAPLAQYFDIGKQDDAIPFGDPKVSTREIWLVLNRTKTSCGLRSESHASGLAVDVASFELANGATLAIKPNGDEQLRATVDSIRVAA